jgi:hypothetical protein
VISGGFGPGIADSCSRDRMGDHSTLHSPIMKG